MPLIKDLQVESDLFQQTYRLREFIIQGDYVRRIAMGTNVSIRTQTHKAATLSLTETLRKVAEPDVQLNQEVFQAYADAEDWVVRLMTEKFKSIAGVGIVPSKFTKTVAGFVEGEEPMVAPASHLVWAPACAFHVGDERVYLWRVMSIARYQSLKTMTAGNSAVVGYTADALGIIAPELKALISRVEDKVVSDSRTVEAYSRLSQLLRPQAYRDEQIKERMEKYEEVGFGGWA